ncbi:unnamed protein product [Orchesella dallaii]|uniref:Gustatory receptor n=1 Tax=Orchesella dallaii TaxID=48710 RepID=A0ABP1R294_9HEXA
MFVGDLLRTFLVLLNRTKIIRFHQNLVELLIEALGPLTQADKQVIKNVIPHAMKILTRYRRIIFVAFCYSAILGQVRTLVAFLTSEKSLDSWSHTIVGIPLFRLFWSALSTLLLLPKLMMMTMFHTLRMYPYILNLQLENINKSKKVGDEEINRILKCFEKQEELTAQMNDAFGWCFAVDMLLTIISIITALFSVEIFLMHKEFGTAASYVVTLILHLAILFELCNAAYLFESECKKSITLLKNIPVRHLGRNGRIQILIQQAKLLSQPFSVKPGSFFHVNRRTLTEIGSAVNTYVIVLVQFHNGESMRCRE